MIGTHRVETRRDGHVTIDGVAFKHWLLARRECPFCGASLDEPAPRYTCACDGWRALRRIILDQPTRHGAQMRLL
jgi:hypothetical protein